MMTMISRLLLLGAALLPLCHGFMGQPSASLAARGAFQLRMSSVSIHQDELSSRILLNKARECAFSEYSNAEEAKQYLMKILEIESGCISGVLVGNELCENVDEMAELVAHLRAKVERHAVVPAATSLAIIPVSIGIAAILMVVASTLDYGQDATPFTIQEWLWAAKGGYLPTMVAHLVRNGGL